MGFQAVLFDLDGTLLNTLDDIADSANRALHMHHFPTHDTDDYRLFIGDGIEMLFARAIPHRFCNEATVRTCAASFRTIYREHWHDRSRPYTGILDLLDALTERHLKLAVLSNKPHEFTGQCVTKLLPNWLFSVVLGHSNEMPPKPDPAGANRIASRLGAKPETILFLGDSGVDMRTAADSGMWPVGALWGFRSAAELQENGAKALITHPMDLLSLMDG